MKKILVACEYSGVVRNAFNSLHGFWAVSCDILPPEDGRIDNHYQGDVRDIINDKWDAMIAFPPCTYLCSSGLHWNKCRPERAAQTESALDFVRFLMDAPIPLIAIENPIGCISSRIRKPDQIIQPYQFGHPESKSTCLWLKGLPLLQPTDLLPTPERGFWDNQTPSHQNKIAPGPMRGHNRARTYSGIGMAMADQWSETIIKSRDR